MKLLALMILCCPVMADVTLAWDPHPDQSVTNFIVYAAPAKNRQILTVTDATNQLNDGTRMQAMIVTNVGNVNLALIRGVDKGRWLLAVSAQNDTEESALSNIVIYQTPLKGNIGTLNVRN